MDDDLVEQNDDDLIVSELDSSDLGSKRQVPETTGLVVVPDHDLVGRGDRVGSASDYGEDLGAVEHPDQSDPATEFAAEGLAEWVAFVNAEADVGAGGEAAMVLVEGEVEDGGRVWAWVGGLVGFGLEFISVGNRKLKRRRGDGGHGFRGFSLFSDFYRQCDCDQGQFNIYMYALVH